MSAPFGRRPAEVIDRIAIGAYTVLRISDAESSRPRAGQFYMLAARTGWGGGAGERPFLPRALSVMRVGPDGELQFLLEDVGPGTRALCALTGGDGVWIAGPFGQGFQESDAAPLLVGGGVGVAPLAILQDELGDAPALLGFRDGAHAAAAQLLHDAEVATDDGSEGEHGFVTALLQREFSGARVSTCVYACGPPAMLASVSMLCRSHDVPAQLALEAPMACGFGACFGCVVPCADGEFRRVCIDGPVFWEQEISWA